MEGLQATRYGDEFVPFAERLAYAALSAQQHGRKAETFGITHSAAWLRSSVAGMSMIPADGCSQSRRDYSQTPSIDGP